MRQLGGCDDGHCPKIFQMDDGTIRVQGLTVNQPDLPEYEGIVEIPESVMAEAIAAVLADV